MAYPTGRSNTLILEIETTKGWYGYAGDFQPFALDFPVSDIVSESEIADPSQYSKIASDLLRKEMTDSLIIILPNGTSGQTKQKVLDNLCVHRVCRSVFFIPRAVCEAFGNGRSNAVIFNHSCNTTSVSLVIKGELISTDFFSNVFNSTLQKLREILGNKGDALLESMNFDEYYEERSRLENIVEELVEDTLGGLERAFMVLKKAQQKKSFGQGCIVITGDILKYLSLFERIIERAEISLGSNVKDVITYNQQLPAGFTGASIVGSNPKSKIIFIEPGTVKYE